MAAPCKNVCDEDSIKNDKFRDCFKFFKRKNPPPDLSSVLNFDDIDCMKNDKIVPLEITDPVCQLKIEGLKEPSLWKIYTISDMPGFVFICNPFEDIGQKYWLKRCLKDFHCKPNTTNLDSFHKIEPNDNIWELGKNHTGKGKSLMNQLRWATLGYHHNWDTKKYNRENHNPMPEDVFILSRYIAQAIGWPNYTAEAAIINYYHLDSTLSGHTDHSEFDHEAPLISISFGQPCIFLVGGTTKAETPLPVFLHSGDIAIMMGPRRLAYHAVPKVLKYSDGLPKPLQCDRNEKILQCDVLDIMCKSQCSVCHDESTKASSCLCSDIKNLNKSIKEELQTLDWVEYMDYLQTSRVNMNVRQVFKPGEGFPILENEEESCSAKRTKLHS